MVDPLSLFAVLGSSTIGATGIGAPLALIGSGSPFAVGASLSTVTLSGTLGAFGIGSSFALQAGLAVGLNVASRLLAPKPKAQDVFAIFEDVSMGRLRVYGRARLGGKRVFAYHRNNRYYEVICHAQGPVTAIVEHWLGRKKVTLNAFDRVITDPYNFRGEWVTLETHLGDQTEASPLLRADLPDIWTEDHIGLGLCYTVMRCEGPRARHVATVFNAGRPDVSVVVQGPALFDPRTEEDVVSDNAALVIRDYLENADGFQGTQGRTDTASFIAFADLCDEEVQRFGGGVEPRYRLWGAVSMTEESVSVLRRMAEACDAEIYETIQGKIAIRGGRRLAVPGITLTDADIISVDALSDGEPAIRATNKVEFTFTSVAANYQTVPGVAFVDAAGIAARGELPVSLALPMCPSHSQGRRLAKIHMARLNPLSRVSLAAKPRCIKLWGEQGFRLELDGLGYQADLRLAGPMRVPAVPITRVEIRAEQRDEAAAYDWNYLVHDVAPPAPPSVDDSTTAPPVPTGFDMQAGTVVINEAVAGVRLVFTWDPPTNSAGPITYLSTDVRYRPVGETDWITVTAEAGATVVATGLVSDGVEYEAQPRHVAGTGREGAWGDLISATAVADPTAPPAPTSLASGVSSGIVTLSWINGNAANFYAARVYRRPDGAGSGADVEVATVYGGVGQSRSTTDIPGTGAFEYRVVSLNASLVASAAAGPLDVTV